MCDDYSQSIKNLGLKEQGGDFRLQIETNGVLHHSLLPFGAVYTGNFT